MKTPTPTAIKKARKAAKLSQEEAAALVGYTRYAWCRWETGSRPMRPALFDMFRAKVSNGFT